MHPFEDLSVPGDSVAIHWFGQSSFALKNAAGTIVQLDPYFPRERPADRFLHPRPPLHEATLRTDCVALTHAHGDHTCIESITRIRGAFPDTLFVGPPESIRKIEGAGVPADRTRVITAGETQVIAGVELHAVWSKPPEGIPAEDIPPPDVQHLGYLIDMDPVSVYVSGDPVNSFAQHEDLVAPIRALKPELGLLTTHPSEGEFPDFDGAAALAEKIGLITAVPAHYQCFVRRSYDPVEFARHLRGVKPLVIPYNQSVVYRTLRVH